MAFRQKFQQHLSGDFIYSFMQLRCYNSEADWTTVIRLKNLIHEKLKSRERNGSFQRMLPEAAGVLKARAVLIEGVSSLIKSFPIKSCKFCPEVYIGETGHQIRTCHGFRRITKNQVHHWTDGNVNNILVPLEAYHHQNIFQDAKENDHGFSFGHVPAVVELCYQAGANLSTKKLYYQKNIADGREDGDNLPNELRLLAQRTLEGWENLRSGVQKLLLAYPAKVCKYCSEVHVGPHEYSARLHEIFSKPRSRSHQWKMAGVDDLIPPKVVWHRRPHDPPILVESGRGFYGRAPAVVSLCAQAGARVPVKYSSMMKLLGLTKS